MNLSVVIPAFNESLRLGPTLRRVVEYLKQSGLSYEVLVVDDGSTDGTSEVARQFASEGVRVLRQEVNRGKGAVLKAGVLESRGREVLLCDADLSTPIEDIERLRPHLDEAEVVLGSRAVASSQIEQHQPFYREMMGRTFNFIIQLVGVRGLRDTQCGFKLLDGDVARQLFAELQIQRFAYDVELVWLARRHGYRVAEVGVRWKDSPSSKVNPLTDSFRMFLDVLSLRLRDWKQGRPSSSPNAARKPSRSPGR
ncbi:MAG TPA: dolichyl-phosphate beta-glucosyltransferase [Thermoanaerobaculia bacterium]|nr:dolichyl-phosphate beta-glucosyltransferase [Thermoanaerobaculia bacterium]